MEMEEAGTEADCEEAIKKAQAAVTELYHFNAHYFEHHDVSLAGQKAKDVSEKMKGAVSLLDSLQDHLPKVQYLSLKGRALNILPEFNKEAEECLSKAVKQDPSLVEAWCSLGESYWKAGNVQQAHDCFKGSLAHVKHKESLRNLSMVLRQLGKDAAEKELKVKESVERAKEAVALDVKDGTSWMVLGNAYLSLFFTTNQDAKVLKQCNSAYAQAEKDPVSANNPDLHYNKATLCQYEEDYPAMMSELSQASLLDPSWSTPRERLDATWRLLKSMAHLITTKGKVKSKVLTTLTSKLSNTDRYLGDSCKGKTSTLISSLEDGVNKDKVLVAAVAANIPSKERVPYACVVVDSSGESTGLTLYNMAVSFSFSQGDVVTIPDPCFRRTSVKHNDESVDFTNVRVISPAHLLLNGSKLSPDKLAPSTVSITAFS